MELFEELFGDLFLENLPIPFFSVTTDLSHADSLTHETGPIQKYVLASLDIPVIGPPVLDDGRLLVDGGVLNNLPVDEMLTRVDGRVIGVDVSPYKVLHGPRNRVEPPSPYELLWDKLIGTNNLDMPTIFEILWQTVTINNVFEREDKHDMADRILEPPVGEYDLFDWGRLDDLIEAGYRTTRSYLLEDSLRVD